MLVYYFLISLHEWHTASRFSLSGKSVCAWCKIDWTSLTVLRISFLKCNVSTSSEALACSASSRAISKNPWHFPTKISDPSTRATFEQRIPLGRTDNLAWESASFCHFSIIRSVSFSFFLRSATCDARRPCRVVRVRWSSALVCLCAVSDAWVFLRAALSPELLRCFPWEEWTWHTWGVICEDLFLFQHWQLSR